MQKTLILSLLLVTSIFAKAQKGKASFYADKFVGRKTASGEIYVHNKKTAAHRTLPFGTMVKVTNLKNNKSVIVKVNDRGPFVKGRIIDLSKSAAQAIGAVQMGVIDVKIEVLDKNQIPEEQTIEDDTHTTSLYYKINVSQKSLGGYGVQVASFSSLDNLFDLLNKISKITNEEPFVESATVKGKYTSRLIVGSFNSRKKAEHLQNKLKQTFHDCIIRKL